MKLSYTLCSLALVVHSVTAVSQEVKPYVFLDSSTLKNNLEGSLLGTVKFAQTHTVDPTGNSEQEMPHLTSTRDTLVMLIPQQQVTAITLEAHNKQGELLGSLQMRPPAQLPKADRPPQATNPDVVYSDNAWSQKLPAKWIKPGLTLTFRSGNNLKAHLNKIDIGGETQVVLQNIRIGMLTEPGELKDNPMESASVEFARDYFQKIPVTQLIVGNYEPVRWDEIVLSSGKKYRTRSDDKGDVHNGDLRENIAKNLISIGIDNANFGINSSPGHTGVQPGLFHIVTAHQSWGNYLNGRVRHGLSGGQGMATLYDTVGNEFSHELGHTYGMGHYPGGGRWAVHNLNSGWGWDAYKNRFIANFFWDRMGDTVSGEENDNYVTPPFKGIHKFNRDTMGGGDASSPLSKYTLHTGYTQKRIQQYLEKTGVITPLSSTGYLIWDEKKQQMVETKGDERRKPEKFGVPVTTVVGFYAPEGKEESYVYPVLHGSYGYVYSGQKPHAGQCWAEVTYGRSGTEQFPLEGMRFDDSHMNKFHINLDTSKEPKTLGIFCPDVDMGFVYRDWKTKKLNTEKIHSWDDKDQKLGDVYVSPDRQAPGGAYYFRLLKKPFWYFPTKAESNADWQYVTDEKSLKKQFNLELSELAPNYFGEKELVRHAIEATRIKPMPPAIVGHLNDGGKTSTTPVPGNDTAESNTIGGSSPDEVSLETPNEKTTDQNQAFVDTAKMNLATLEEDNSVTFNVQVTSEKTPADKAKYEWVLPSEAKGHPTDQARQTFSVNKQEKTQQLMVSVDISAGQSSRTLIQRVAVPAKKIVNNTGTIPDWDASKTYSEFCQKVRYEGKVWLNGWRTKGEKPSQSGRWGVWQAQGSSNMHRVCRPYDSGYQDYGSGYQDYGSGYQDYGSGYQDYGSGYQDYGSGYQDYGSGYQDYGSGYQDYGSGYQDYGSGYQDYGSGYQDYGSRYQNYGSSFYNRR